MVLAYTNKMYEEKITANKLDDPASYAVLALRLVNRPLFDFNPEVFISEVCLISTEWKIGQNISWMGNQYPLSTILEHYSAQYLFVPFLPSHGHIIFCRIFRTLTGPLDRI